MSQSTLDDDELFGEAASEMRDDVEDSLAAARGELPDADEVWEIDADNTLGALNALRSALSVDGASDHLRDAKKWYTMGERADAFENAEDLADAIETTEALIEEVETAREQVGDLTSAVPQLRSSLEEAAEDAASQTGTDAETADDAESDADDADTDADADGSEAEAEA